MKCFVLTVKAWTQKGRLVMGDVLKVFASEELGEQYIRDTWPDAQYQCDDSYGKHWVLEPTDEWMWRGIYQLQEMEIEGL